MTEKDQVQTLVEEAATSGPALGQQRGVAFYDTEKDARLTALRAFGDAERAISQLPQFATRFGADSVRRITLQFVYQYFGRTDSMRYDGAVFDALWDDFAAELGNPYWTTRGIANVRFFTSQKLNIDLGDGMEDGISRNFPRSDSAKRCWIGLWMTGPALEQAPS
ncbi:hypothetical protein SBA3_790011 [Candidatus Sulfopaludibacter sp. SbA3]|nr:hypothetical protein SBA3_790011 [Candidatus Sulfopaludibacter sp. SbA3]